MFAKNQDDVKLEWMYKGAHSTIDREEYLLGRNVDRTLEELNEEEKQQQSGPAQPRNHVEHECIPPSIRDYSEQIGEQVDLAAKLQEDPLIAIKKREDEKRRQFLNNPLQIKKLQKALKFQRKEKKKRREDDSDDDLDLKLANKIKQLKNSTLEDQKSAKKSKSDNNLETILMHKYHLLKNQLSDYDIKNILQGEESDSSSSSDSSDSDKVVKKGMKNKKGYTDGDGDRDNKKIMNKYNRKDVRGESSMGIQRKRNENERYDRYKSKSHDSRNNHHRTSSNATRTRNYDEKMESRQTRTNYNSSSNREYKDREGFYHMSNKQENVKKSNKDSKEDKKPHKRNVKDSSDSNTEDEYQQNQSYSKYSDSDSDTAKKKKSYGLVKADGTRIGLIKTSGKSSSTSSKQKPPENILPAVHKYKNLTEEEKEKKRKEMMANAVWRDTERTKTVKKYRENEKKEADALKKFDRDFLHKELVKSAKTGSVESRIKANINNIQRSGGDMNKHFSRRYR